MRSGTNCTSASRQECQHITSNPRFDYRISVAFGDPRRHPLASMLLKMRPVDDSIPTASTIELDNSIFKAISASACFPDRELLGPHAAVEIILRTDSGIELRPHVLTRRETGWNVRA
jgi:hypothetical protein